MKKILNIAYHCGKICEGSHNHHEHTYRELGKVNVSYVGQRLAEMLSDIPSSPEWKDVRDLQHRLEFDFDPVKHALKFLEAFFLNSNPTDDDRLTAIVFACYLDDRVPKLVRDFGYEDKPAT